MKKTNVNKLTVSIALITALCIPAFASAGTTVGSVRNSLSDNELIRLDREEDKARTWFTESNHIKTETSTGSVRSNLSDIELNALNRDEDSSISASDTGVSIGSIRAALSDADQAKLDHEEDNSRS